MAVRYFDRKGHPLTLMQWADLFEVNPDGYRFVANTQVGPWHISTVWLGLDHSFGWGPPLIFETMVFGEGAPDVQERYPTEEMALAGHDEIVGRMKELTR